MCTFVRFSAKMSQKAMFLDIPDVNKLLNFTAKFGNSKLLVYLCGEVLRFI